MRQNEGRRLTNLQSENKMNIKADQKKFELRTDDVMMIRSLVDALVTKERQVIKENIEEISNKNEEILNKLNDELIETKEKIERELSKIDDVLGKSVIKDKDGNLITKEKYEELSKQIDFDKKNYKKIREDNGKLKEAQRKVKDLEKKFDLAMHQANITEKKYHAYLMAKEEYDLESSSMYSDERKLKDLQEKMDKYEDTYLDHIEWQKNSEDIYDELQDAKNELSEIEDRVESFKHVDDEHLELDRDSSSKTDDNLGHYISTHWGAKQKRLENLIKLMTGLVIKNNTNEKITEFQNAFNQNVKNIIFNNFIKTIKSVTNQMFFSGMEFSKDNRDEFIEYMLRGMPYDLPEHFNPFYSILKDGRAVDIINDGEGINAKVLDLDKVSPSDISTNFCQFVSKHFDTACRMALKHFKDKRDNIVEDYEFSNNDDESDGFSRIEKKLQTDEDYSFGRDGDYNNPNRLDPSTVDFWSELKLYMLQNSNEMAKDAAIAMRDYLPKKAYIQMLPEARAIAEVQNVIKKLINAADQELRNGRPIAKKLKDILLLALGGAGNFEELEIEFNSIYATFELYMYKFMIEQEEKNRNEGDAYTRRNRSRYIERLKDKRDDAQRKLNDPELADYAFNACVNIKNTRLNDKINFLLNNKRTTDGSGKDNSFIIDPHPERM